MDPLEERASSMMSLILSSDTDFASHSIARGLTLVGFETWN